VEILSGIPFVSNCPRYARKFFLSSENGDNISHAEPLIPSESQTLNNMVGSAGAGDRLFSLTFMCVRLVPMWDLQTEGGEAASTREQRKEREQQSLTLLTAVKQGRAEDVFNALQAGAHPDGDIGGVPDRTPALIEAVGARRMRWFGSGEHKGKLLDIVEMLLDSGADVRRTNMCAWYGETCLHRAAGTPWTHEAGVMSALIAHVKATDGNLDPLDAQECTPLHWAAQWGNVEHVKALSQAGADINHADKKGEGLYTMQTVVTLA
jgi:hypothetical protein